MKPDWAAKIALEKFPGGSDGRTRDIFARALRRERAAARERCAILCETLWKDNKVGKAYAAAIRGQEP